jgi:hypothetical protein
MNRAKGISNKVSRLFKENVGEVVSTLDGFVFPDEIRDLIADALSPDLGAERASDIAFHMVDWNGDAAFIVALLLWPERFTKDEVLQGIYAFLCHAPDHLAAAAKLLGVPVTDVFEVGALDGDDEEHPATG